MTVYAFQLSYGVNRIGGVMVTVRWIVGSIPGRVKQKTMKLVFVSSPLGSIIKENEQRLVGSETD